MKGLKILLILIMASMIIPSVQALTVSQTRFTDGMTTTFASLEATPYIDVTVTGMNTATHRYVLYVQMGRAVNDYPPELAGTFTDTFSGSVYMANITSGVNRVTFEPDDFPFEFSQQDYTLYVTSFWKSNNTQDWSETALSTGSFNISGADDPAIVYNINLANCLPENLNLGASPYVNKGISLDLFAIMSYAGDYNYSSIPVAYFITDNTTDRHILGYGNGTVYYTHRGSVLTYAYGFQPIHRISPYPLQLDHGYYFYVGIKIEGAYTLANTMVSCSDGSMFALDFSTNGYTTASHLKEEPVLGAWTYGNHYTGACSYFETGIGNTKGSFTFTVGTLGLIIRNWGDSVGGTGFGMILALLIGFMITMIFLSIPFQLSLKFHFKMPNYIYGVFIILGVTTDFGLGIVELWQYAFFILCVALTVVVRFREEIGEYVSAPEGLFAKIKSQPKAEAYPTALPPYKGQRDYTRAEKIRMMRDAGVKKPESLDAQKQRHFEEMEKRKGNGFHRIKVDEAPVISSGKGWSIRENGVKRYVTKKKVKR